MDAICNVCGAVTVISAEGEDAGRAQSPAPFACASCGEYGQAEVRPTSGEGPGSGAAPPPLRRPLPCSTRDDDDPTMVDLRSIIMKSLAAVAVTNASKPREGDEEVPRLPSRRATLVGWPAPQMPPTPPTPARPATPATPATPPTLAPPAAAAAPPPEASVAEIQAPESVRQIVQVCDSIVPAAPSPCAPMPRRAWPIALAAAPPAVIAAVLAGTIGISLGGEARPPALTAGLQQLAVDTAWALLPQRPPDAGCPVDARTAVTPGARRQQPAAASPAAPAPPLAAAPAARPAARSASGASNPSAPKPGAAPEAPKSQEQMLAEAMAAAVGAPPPKRGSGNGNGNGSGDGNGNGSGSRSGSGTGSAHED